MKLNRILAGMSAAAMAASMLTMITASAADSSTLKVTLQTSAWAELSASTTVTADGDYSLDVTGISASSFANTGFFEVGAAEKAVTCTVNTITVNDNYTLTVGKPIDTADSTGNGLANIWNPEGKAEVVFTGEGCSFKGDNGSTIKFFVGDTETNVTSITYNVTVNGYSEGGAETSYPDDAVFGGAGESWQKVAFDSVKDLALTAWDGLWLQMDYGKDGYEPADETNAKLVIKIDADETVATGSVLFRIGDTTDATTHAYTAEAEGTSFTVEIPITELKAFKDAEGYDAVNGWDNGFGCGFQTGVAGKITAYVTGMEYTPSEGDGSSEPDSKPATSYTAVEMFTDSSWGWGNWLPNGVEKEDGSDIGKGTDAEITGDGTYTVSISAEQVAAWYDEAGNQVAAGTEGATPAPASGVNVWCVDILTLADALGAGSADLGKDVTNAEKMELVKNAGVTFSDVSLIIDGDTVYTYDDSELLYADIEGNGNLRLEIFNTYGDTKENAPDAVKALSTDLVAEDEIAVTFTINGLPEELPEPPASSEDGKDDSKGDGSKADSKTDSATTSSKTDNKGSDKNPSTGAAALATVGVLLAGAAVVATKKK